MELNITSKSRGNNTIFRDGKWYYENTNDLVSENHKTKSCGNCGRVYTADGHDGCLGNLIGIMNACCGHGEENQAYIQFWDGECIKGNDAITILNILKKHRRKDGEEPKEIYVKGIGWVNTK